MADPNDEESPKKRKPVKLPFDTTDLYDFEFANSLPKKFTQNYTNVFPQVPELTITAGSSRITKVQKPKVPPRLNAEKVCSIVPPFPNNPIREENQTPDYFETDSLELFSFPEPKMPPPGPPPLPPRRQLPKKVVHSAPASNSISRVESSNPPQVNPRQKQHLTKEIVIKSDIEPRNEVKIKLVPERDIIYKSANDLDSRLYIREQLIDVDSKSSYNVSLLTTDDEAGPSASKNSLSPEKNARILNWMSDGKSIAKSMPKPTSSKRPERSSSMKSADKAPSLTLTKSEVFEFSDKLNAPKSNNAIVNGIPAKNYPGAEAKSISNERKLETPPEKIISITRGNIEGNSIGAQYFVPGTENVISLNHGLNISEDEKSSESSVDISRIMPTKSTLDNLEKLTLNKIDSQDSKICELTESTIEKIADEIQPKLNPIPELLPVDNKSQQILALREDITEKLVSMLSKNSPGVISPQSIELAKGLSEKLTSKLPKDISENAISLLHKKLSEKFGLSSGGCKLECGSSAGPNISNSFLKALPEVKPSATQVSQHKSDMLYLPIGIPVVAKSDKKPDVVGIGKHLDSYLSKMLSHCSISEPQEESKRTIATAPASLMSILPNVPSTQYVNLEQNINSDSKVSLTVMQIPRTSNHSIIQKEIPDLQNLQSVQDLLRENIRSVRQIHSENKASLDPKSSTALKQVPSENEKSFTRMNSESQKYIKRTSEIEEPSEIEEHIGRVPSENQFCVKQIFSKSPESLRRVPIENQESMTLMSRKMQESVRRINSKNEESDEQPHWENEVTVKSIASKNPESLRRIPSENQESLRRIPSKNQESLRRIASENQESEIRIPTETKETIAEVPSKNQVSVKRISSKTKKSLTRVSSENQESMRRIPSENRESGTRIPKESEESIGQVPSENQVSAKRRPSKNQKSVTILLPSENIESVRRIPHKNEETIERVPIENKVSAKRIPSGIQNVESLKQIPNANKKSMSRVSSENEESIRRKPSENRVSVKGIPSKTKKSLSRISIEKEESVERLPNDIEKVQSVKQIPGVLPNTKSVTRIRNENPETEEEPPNVIRIQSRNRIPSTIDVAQSIDRISSAIQDQESAQEIPSAIHNVKSLTRISSIQNTQSVNEIPSSIQNLQSVKGIPSPIQNAQSVKGIPSAIEIQNTKSVKEIPVENSKLIGNENSQSIISSIVAVDKLSSSFGIDSDNPSLIQQGFIVRKLPSGVTVNFRSLPQRSFVSVSRLRNDQEYNNAESQYSQNIFEIANEPTRQMSHTSVESVGGNSNASNEKSQTASPNVSSIVFSQTSLNDAETKFKTDVFNDLISRFGSTTILNDVYGQQPKGEANLYVADSMSDMPTIEEETDEYEETSVSQYSLVAHKGSLQSNPSLLSDDSDDGREYRSDGPSTTHVESRMTQAPSSTASVTKPKRSDTSQERYHKMTNQMVDILAKVEKKIEIMDDHLVKIAQKQEKMKTKSIITPAKSENAKGGSSSAKMPQSILSGLDNVKSVKWVSSENQKSVVGIPSENEVSMKKFGGKLKTPAQESSKSGTKTGAKLTVTVSTKTNAKPLKQNMLPSVKESAKIPKGKAKLRREPAMVDYSSRNQRNFIQENIQRVSGGRGNSAGYSFMQNNGSYSNRNKEYLGLSDRQISEFLLNNFPITTATVSEMVSKPIFANDHEIRKAVRSELASLLETNPALNHMPLKRQAKSIATSDMSRDINRYIHGENEYIPSAKGRSAPQKSPYAKKQP